MIGAKNGNQVVIDFWKAVKYFWQKKLEGPQKKWPNFYKLSKERSEVKNPFVGVENKELSEL